LTPFLGQLRRDRTAILRRDSASTLQRAGALGESRRRSAVVVHSDPEILGGTPVFVGTRVPVKTLYDYLGAGDTLDEFLNDFPSVTREQAVAALELAREMTEARATVAR
jgi:uncharacterized protein (DUF433 family)